MQRALENILKRDDEVSRLTNLNDITPDGLAASTRRSAILVSERHPLFSQPEPERCATVLRCNCRFGPPPARAGGKRKDPRGSSCKQVHTCLVVIRSMIHPSRLASRSRQAVWPNFS